MIKSEIEQKFLFKYIPFEELELNQYTIVFRKYLSLDPEIRINKRVFQSGEERCHLTVKKGDLFERKEAKIRVTPEEYEELSKTIDEDSLVIDIYDFLLDDKHHISFKSCREIDFSIAEVEYEDRQDYERNKEWISSLSFLSREVTWEQRFYLKNVWERFRVENE